MNTAMPTATSVFTPGERDYIRRELDQFFSTLPRVADGVPIRTWRGGAQAGQPKVPAVAQGLLERGLMRLEPTPWPPRLFFTEAGLLALRAMMSDGRLANPKTFAHVRRELGIDPDPASSQASAAVPSDAGQAVDGSRAAAFPLPPEYDNSPGPTEWNAPMARTTKTDTPPGPARRGRKPKATTASPAMAPSVEDDDTPSAAADAAAAAPAEGSTPARGRRGRKPGPRADAMEPALPPTAGAGRVAAKASPSADGPEPAGDDGDAMIAERAVPVSGEPDGDAGPEEHEDAAPQAGDVVPPFLPADKSAPATPAARWDRASDTVSFDWPAIERTAAQQGANQAMAKLLLAALAEGAQARWPL
jgi:hypothetical protein